MQLPARFGKYELQEFLGGGMSHVYRSVDTVIGRPVAVKILTDEGARDIEAKERFIHEARISGAIQHDHIVTIHDYGEEQGHPYIVMEFLRGGDLREAMRKRQTGDLLNKLRISAEVAAAMEFVHRKGVIHRDIKPENIFVEESGRSKIMDFGISKAVGFNLTKAGNTMGTPFYMSPEQVMGTNITPLVDIYSYGMVLYELFTGERLVSGDSMERLFYVILHENPDPAKLAAAGLPPALSELIIKCTEKKPENRYPSFSEVRTAIEGIISGLRGGVSNGATVVLPSKSAGPSGEKGKSSTNTGLLAGIGVAALLLCGVGAWLLMRAPADKPADRPNTGPAPTLAAKGGDMVLVPGGEFLFGSARSPVKLPAFYMDVTEVSNKAYREFAGAVGKALPEGFAAEAPTLPITNVTFTDAKEFCTWAGKRLPGEREWEKAARGTDGRNYPWGNDGTPGMANAASKGPAPVNSFEAGASPYKILHMTGNVWEWVDHPHTPSAQAIQSFNKALTPPPTSSEPWHYIKGGAFDRSIAEGISYEWSSVPGRLTNPAIGFRCAMDVPETK